MNNFQTIVELIDNENMRSGNDAIYKKCCNSIFVSSSAVIEEKKKVSEYFEGMLWLIGRSYAASPQRRSYGKSKHIIPDKTAKGEYVLRSVWPVKTENSGNGDFFAELAANIVNRKVENASDYEELGQLINRLHDSKYNFNASIITTEQSKLNEDVALMRDSIIAVSKLNRLVKRSTEIFDLVNKYCSYHKHTIPLHFRRNPDIDCDYVYCKNQISFSSKFLHFFCPNTVFIIDQFSEKGGKFLFPGRLSDVEYYISNFEINYDDTASEICSDCFEFNKEFVKSLSEKYKEAKKALRKVLLDSLCCEKEKDKDEIINLYKNSDESITDVKDEDCFFTDI